MPIPENLVIQTIFKVMHPIEYVSCSCCTPVVKDVLGYDRLSDQGALDFYVDYRARSITLFLEVPHGRQILYVEPFAFVLDPVTLSKVLCSEIGCTFLEQEEP